MDVDVYSMNDNLHMHDLKHPMVGERRSGEERRQWEMVVDEDRRKASERRHPETKQGDQQ